MTDTPSVDSVMAKLDAWVARHGDGTYTHPEKRVAPEDSAIQQVRAELYDFVKMLLEEPTRDRALEIGMGKFGGTHYLWRLLYGVVGTIESTHKPIEVYRGEPGYDPTRDVFFYGSSHDPATVYDTHIVFGKLGGVDMLFIDGAHDKPSVLADILLYAPIVKKGGIIALHDVMEDCPGGPAMMLQSQNAIKNITLITHAPGYCGIGWFRK